MISNDDVILTEELHYFFYSQEKTIDLIQLVEISRKKF